MEIPGLSLPETHLFNNQLSSSIWFGDRFRSSRGRRPRRPRKTPSGERHCHALGAVVAGHSETSLV